MVAALVLGASAERRASSSLALSTNPILDFRFWIEEICNLKSVVTQH